MLGFAKVFPNCWHRQARDAMLVYIDIVIICVFCVSLLNEDGLVPMLYNCFSLVKSLY